MRLMSNFKRECRIRMLKACSTFAVTGVWDGRPYYPNCAWDMVEMGLVTPSKEPTFAGRVALYLLGVGEDPLAVPDSGIHVVSGGKD
jgi:hypothetical protein